MPSPVSWSIEADYLQACNCEYGCPCEFEAPPTYGFCEGIGQWQISKGSYGNVKLDGLGIGFAAHWPSALHKGGGTCVWFVDAKATPEQREALTKIATGEAGGMPFEIIRMTMSKMLPTQVVPFQFHAKGKHSSGRMGDAVITAVEPIKNPVSGADESIRVEHETGFLFKSAEIVSNKELTVSFGELKFSHPNKGGFVSKVSYHG
ncbi:MAG TPA: DUF1326 domain-containing protein [Tepidisphaeraceae bacterium]|jgi:hypothetical protein|nr:DUF1326 domain-containing protein [Tepidisphaeraceae bacterium]